MKMTNGKPVIKWAGGKQRVLPKLKERFPVGLKNGDIQRYVEPFLGAGTALIHILQNYPIKEAHVGDINHNLILMYKIIVNRIDDLLIRLKEYDVLYNKMSEEQRKPFFYSVRDKYNEYILENYLSFSEELEQAARFIFLNKTSFNGLYRVNKKFGTYNVSHGRIKNPKILDEKNLLRISKLLSKVKFYVWDYEEASDLIDNKTFVYIDPPYRPVNQNGFTGYDRSAFNDENQKELADFYKQMDKRGACLMMSNSYSEDGFFQTLYSGYNINSIQVNRSINSNVLQRGKVNELLITNY